MAHGEAEWLGRLAAGRVITGLPLLRLKAVIGFVSKLTALHVSGRTVPTTGQHAPAKVFSSQTLLKNITKSISGQLFMG